MPRIAKVPTVPITAARAGRIAAAEASPWYTVAQAAGYVGVGTKVIHQHCADGTLRHARLGGATIRIRREWLDRWLEDLAVSEEKR